MKAPHPGAGLGGALTTSLTHNNLKLKTVQSNVYSIDHAAIGRADAWLLQGAAVMSAVQAGCPGGRSISPIGGRKTAVPYSGVALIMRGKQGARRVFVRGWCGGSVGYRLISSLCYK